MQDLYTLEWGETIDIWFPIGSPRPSGVYCAYSGRFPKFLEFSDEECRLSGKVIDPGRTVFTYHWVDVSGNKRDETVIIIVGGAGEPWILPPPTPTPTPTPPDPSLDELLPTPVPGGGIQSAVTPTAEPAVTPTPEPTPRSYFTARFYCTGSMEPTITCLDTATFLSDPLPSEVEVGSIISFTAECLAGHIAHRVIAIFGIGEEQAYTAQGDSNLKPDPCLVFHANVDGLLLEIHAGANDTPENRALREEVNSALAELRTRDAAHELALARYVELRDRHCVRGEDDVYVCESEAFDEVVRLRDEVNRAVDAYNAALEAWREAYNRALEA